MYQSIPLMRYSVQMFVSFLKKYCISWHQYLKVSSLCAVPQYMWERELLFYTITFLVPFQEVISQPILFIPIAKSGSLNLLTTCVLVSSILRLREVELVSSSRIRPEALVAAEEAWITIYKLKIGTFLITVKSGVAPWFISSSILVFCMKRASRSKICLHCRTIRTGFINFQFLPVHFPTSQLTWNVSQRFSDFTANGRKQLHNAPNLSTWVLKTMMTTRWPGGTVVGTAASQLQGLVSDLELRFCFVAFAYSFSVCGLLPRASVSLHTSKMCCQVNWLLQIVPLE